MVEQDLQLVENAVFTEPDDQSAWWYHHFLFSFICDQTSSLQVGAEEGIHAWFRGVVDQQIAMLKSLLELEEDSKWCLCALANMLLLSHSLRVADDNETDAAREGERRLLLERLIVIDPSHANRYKYLLKEQESGSWVQ